MIWYRLEPLSSVSGDQHQMYVLLVRSVFSRTCVRKRTLFGSYLSQIFPNFFLLTRKENLIAWLVAIPKGVTISIRPSNFTSGEL